MIELARDYWFVLGIAGLLAFLYSLHRTLIHCQHTIQQAIQSQSTQHDTLCEFRKFDHVCLSNYIKHNETKLGELNYSLANIHTSLSVLHSTLHTHRARPTLHDAPEQVMRVD